MAITADEIIATHALREAFGRDGGSCFGVQNPTLLRKAPPGMVRTIYTDPRDHWPSHGSDFATKAEAIRALDDMFAAQRDSMTLYDDKGELILTPHAEK